MKHQKRGGASSLVSKERITYGRLSKFLLCTLSQSFTGASVGLDDGVIVFSWTSQKQLPFN